MELLHSNVWGFDGLELIDNKITLLRLMNHTAKKYSLWMIFGIMNIAPLSLGMRLRQSSSSPWRRMKIGSHLKSNTIDKWRHLLEEDYKGTHLGQLVGYSLTLCTTLF